MYRRIVAQAEKFFFASGGTRPDCSRGTLVREGRPRPGCRPTRQCHRLYKVSPSYMDSLLIRTGHFNLLPETKQGKSSLLTAIDHHRSKMLMFKTIRGKKQGEKIV